MNKIFMLVLALVLALSACSMSADTGQAEQAVKQFHTLLDAGRFVEIYEAASEETRKSTSQKEFVGLLEAVHRKLGNTKSSQRTGMFVNYSTSGTFVRLTYETEYAEGKASEEFGFRLQKNEPAVLVRFNINSNALILK